MKSVLKKIVPPIVLVLLILAFAQSMQPKPVKKAIPTPTPVVVKEIKFTPEQLTQYYHVYTNPYVLAIRKALNGYLDRTMAGITIPSDVVVKSAKSSDGSLEGLDSFSKDYYKSKFIVYTIVDSVTGGKAINIIFQDKPDRIFFTWVYKLADGTYELRGFAQNNEFTSQDIKNINIEYKTLIADKQHSL